MYTNFFYFYKINEIGGVETFYYNLAKKYKAKDITICYTVGDKKQIRRLQKYVRVLQYRGQKIQCKRAFFNFNLDIIDNVEAEEYYQILHGDYKAMGYLPNSDPRITKYLACSKQVADSFHEITGAEVEVCYNPTDDLKRPGKLLRLVSATRLSSEKGKERIEKMADLLDAAGVSYSWDIFSDTKTLINNEHIALRKSTLDILPYVADADWLVQLSDNEGYCYSVIEALQIGTPVIVTPCPVFKELGLNDANSITVDFDFEEIPVDRIVKGLPAFTYKPKKDTWNKYLGKEKATYKINEKALVRGIITYYDLKLERNVERNEEVEMPRDRAEYLADLELVEILT